MENQEDQKKNTPKMKSLKDLSLEEHISNYEKNEMLDDHGEVIIGDREKKPEHPE